MRTTRGRRRRDASVWPDVRRRKLSPELSDDCAQDGLHQVELEAGDHDGFLELPGEEGIGGSADHGPDMGRADEAVDAPAAELADVRALEDVLERRRRQHVVAEYGEAGESLVCGKPDGERVGGVVVSKPMAKNTTSRSGSAAVMRAGLIMSRDGALVHVRRWSISTATAG